MFTTDGSDQIYIVDENFTIQAQKSIKGLSGNPQQNINELEFVDNYIYANIYLSTIIVKIDLDKGSVIE